MITEPLFSYIPRVYDDITFPAFSYRMSTKDTLRTNYNDTLEIYTLKSCTIFEEL